MKKIILLTVLAMIVLCAGQTFGDPEIKTSGQVRLRCEFDGKSFDKDAATVNTGFLRTRFNVDATINENTSAYIQFQEGSLATKDEAPRKARAQGTDHPPRRS